VPRRPAVGFEDLDVVVVERDEELFDLAGFGVGDAAGDVLLGEVALLLAARDEALRLLAVLGMDPDALRGRRLRGFLVFGRCLGPLLLLLSAAKDGRPLQRTLDLFQIVRQAAYLLVEPADVPVRTRERRAHIHEPSPQVLFPKPERDDLDLVTRVGP
jgi:hypothetical protein